MYDKILLLGSTPCWPPSPARKGQGPARPGAL